jgi:hypothetical protein
MSLMGSANSDPRHCAASRLDVHPQPSPTIHRAALDNQSSTETARIKDGTLDRLTLFVYRIGA